MEADAAFLRTSKSGVCGRPQHGLGVRTLCSPDQLLPATYPNRYAGGVDVGEKIRSARRRRGLTQAELAQRAGTSQATVAAYERGRKSPAVATLGRLARALDADLHIDILSWSSHEHDERPAGELRREELRSLWLHRVIAVAIQSDPHSALTLAEHNLGTMRGADRRRMAEHWLEEWEALLHGPLDNLLATLCSTSRHASQLRQCAPFSGLLTARERWAAYRAFGERQHSGPGDATRTA